MVLVSSGAISLANLQTEFGGTNPIGLNEYYTTGYASGVTGIPASGQISLNQFYGKSKPASGGYTNYMTAGNVAGNMDTTNGSGMGIDGVDDSYGGIGTVGFPFYWFGADYGSSSAIYWNTNQALTFGNASTQYTNWSPGTARGVLMGQYDRRTNWSRFYTPYTTNSHSVKRINVNQANYYATSGSEIQMEIRLIRGPEYQYIEIRMAYWAAGTGGQWVLSDGGSFYYPFSGAPPVGTGASVVLRGDLNGYNWVAYNNYYMNI